MIQGLGLNLASWDPDFIKDLCGHRVIVFDNRGTGQSDRPDVEYSIKMMAGDAVGLMDALRIENSDILGLSMGGMIAQELALNQQGKVRNLILCSTVCKSSRIPLRADLFESYSSIPDLTLEEFIGQSFRLVYTSRYIEENRNRLEELARRILEHEPHPSMEQMLATLTKHFQAVVMHDTFDRLSDVSVPTLVMAGGEDILVPTEESRILAERIPNARLVIFEGAGHDFLTEVRDRAVQKILEFIEKR